MQVNLKSELKTWFVFAVALIAAVFLHEFGHCVAAWLYGVKAIPTFAKAYYNYNASPGVANLISLGGIIGTVIAWLLAVALFLFTKFKLKSAVLAASLANLGVYCFRFVLKGRGHDATEFQQAQTALGANYPGHFVDWLFACLFIIGCTIWFMRCKPGVKIIPRIFIGAIVSVLLLIALQTINNKIFDPLF